MNYILIAVMTLVASFASFFLKKSTSGGSVISIITNKFLYIGGFLYLAASMANIYLLQIMDYSIVVPVGATCYIWTMFIAYIFLGEKITLKKIIGIALILVGVICVAINF